MKNLLKCFLLAAVFVTVFSTKGYSSNFFSADSQEVLKQYSLFSEYYKNKDFESAIPYGWTVIQLNPKMMAKWIYYRMEDTYWHLHDSTDATDEQKKQYADTTVYLYTLAIENYPDDKAYFQARKSYVLESWLSSPAEVVIPEYEKAIEYNADINPYFYHRLGQLYKRMADENEEYKEKALNLYTKLSEREPDNSQWPNELESLVDNIDELVDLKKKAWDLDKENISKAYNFAEFAIKANRFEEAIGALEFLVEKNPETVNYWTKLSTAYQKTDNTAKAEQAYEKLIKLEPENKNHYLNLGIIYKDKGQLSAARNMYQKASTAGGSWALPIYYEGLLYEQSARSCSDFDAKIVYQIALDTYRKALGMDGSLSQARERIGALSGAVPSQEDYFFKGYKSGQSLSVPSCAGWIGKSITVP